MDCILDPLLLEEFHRNCPNCPAPRGRFYPRRHVRASPQSLQSSAPTFTRSLSPASNQAPLYLHTLHTPSSSGLPFTPEPSQNSVYLPVCFLISDAPVSPPLLLSSTPRIHARDHSYSHCKLSYLDLVTLCFTHLSSPPGYSSVSFNKYPCVITYLCVS